MSDDGDGKLSRVQGLFVWAVIMLLFFVINIGALAMLHRPDVQEAAAPSEAANNPGLAGAYLVSILVATGILLLLIKFNWRRVLYAIGLFFAWDAIAAVLLLGVPTQDPMLEASFLVVALAGPLLLHFYPEWWVINLVAIPFGMVGVAVLGSSFGPLPLLLLLVGLAIYDLIAVYGTGHMITLAKGLADINLPAFIVIPLQRGYSLRDDGLDSDNAVGVGLGDLVFPSLLSISPLMFGIGGSASVGAFAGTLIGALALVMLLTRGGGHPGLPLLNGGAIAGYFIGAAYGGVSLAVAAGVV